ncbi:Uncharacterised protein [Porphyromonas cangingivalis]|uniref:Uncharacterized protein n=1 Tax=Porphyromonas cangingivalis TaxID=36874 RepID=A0A1T4KNH3_PORCN|nr:hypothetical protein SAMN02745205_00805 [Porphyromonas cangingivalis]SPY34725.1 Uncharacterised protein [Porphyromonas cangingivalis]VEJ02533.1 Uncharacterised protein [Porphyromonas cangingivalis]
MVIAKFIYFLYFSGVLYDTKRRVEDRITFFELRVKTLIFFFQRTWKYVSVV